MTKHYSIAYSPLALDDLRSICNYIIDAIGVPKTAKQQVNRIKNAIRALETMPMRHPLLDWEPWESSGLRKMTIDNYVVFYRVEENRGEVQVVRIAYGGRDLISLLEHKN